MCVQCVCQGSVRGVLCVREVVSGKCVSTQDKKKKEIREKRSWSKGRMLPSQGSDPGSSPGGRIFVRKFKEIKSMAEASGQVG